MPNNEPSTSFTLVLQHKTTKARRGQVTVILKYLSAGAILAYWLGRLLQVLHWQ